MEIDVLSLISDQAPISVAAVGAWGRPAYSSLSLGSFIVMGFHRDVDDVGLEFVFRQLAREFHSEDMVSYYQLIRHVGHERWEELKQLFYGISEMGALV
ncbi:hypothetical protein VUR80DRAFT_8431 [Thermomyces stellatus]